MADSDNSSSRDTRLLALVILIALVVLFVLARFRFPATETRPVVVAPGPLERLAARATYDDLAAVIQTFLQRATTSIVVTELEADTAAGAPPRNLPPGAPPPDRLLVSGVRLKGDLAVVSVPAGYRVLPVRDVIAVHLADAKRGVAVVVAPATGAPERPAIGAEDFGGFVYVAVVEPTPTGLTAEPVFIGRIDRIQDDRWGGLLAPGGSAKLSPGALVFSLDGRFLGIVTTLPKGATGVIPAARLEAFVESVAGGSPAGGS